MQKIALNFSGEFKKEINRDTIDILQKSAVSYEQPIIILICNE